MPTVPPTPHPPYHTEPGARILAGKIRAYWADLGYTSVTTRIMREGNSGDYLVLTNLVNGMPPQKAEKREPRRR